MTMMTNNRGYIGYQLREAQKRQEIASIFADAQNPDDFIAGYVLCVGAKSCVVESVNTFGSFDGWFAIKLDCIVEVSMEDQYAARLMQIAGIDRYIRRGLPDEPQFPVRPEDWHEADGVAMALHFAMRCGCVVTCWTASDACAGFVQQLDDLYVTMILLDFFGAACTEMKFRLLDIEMVSIRSEEEMMYEKLNAHS